MLKAELTKKNHLLGARKLARNNKKLYTFCRGKKVRKIVYKLLLFNESTYKVRVSMRKKYSSESNIILRKVQYQDLLLDCRKNSTIGINLKFQAKKLGIKSPK